MRWWGAEGGWRPKNLPWRGGYFLAGMRITADIEYLHIASLCCWPM